MTSFQRLLDALDDMDIGDETIVVFSSDHGDMHGSHGVYKKQWPWNEALRVPFVLRYPGVVPASARVEAPLNVIDVMPTLLGLAGLPIPDTVEGVDLSPVLTGEDEDAPESVLIMNPCPFSIGDTRGHDQYPTYKGMRLEYRGVVTRQYTYVCTHRPAVAAVRQRRRSLPDAKPHRRQGVGRRPRSPRTA